MVVFWPFRSFLLWFFLVPISGFFTQVAAQSVTPTSRDETAQAQGSPDASIAAAARNSKNAKGTRAKKMVTDEDMEETAGPLPRLKMDGAENSDEVVVAITHYKRNHTAEQTEQAVRIWYDRYDQMLSTAIQSNIDIKTIRQANLTNVEDLCQESRDYQQCETRRMAEYRGQRNDQAEIANNLALEVRLQHALNKVRIGLAINNLRYDWFKLRTTNGIDTY
jgi:hypothetical protein